MTILNRVGTPLLELQHRESMGLLRPDIVPRHKFWKPTHLILELVASIKTKMRGAKARTTL
eukprot:7275714-Pyramimonas_sp.AAC.1